MYIDTHLDTLSQSLRVERKFSELSDEGHVDLVKAREAGLFLGFFTGFPTESAYATERMMRRWIEFVNNTDNHLRQVADLNDLEQHTQHFSAVDGMEHDIGAVLHFEGAAGIDTELNKLYIYHGLGLRSMSLTWNEQNQFATGVKGEKNRGLTMEGTDLIDKMADLGIIVDISHLNDTSFWDVIEYYDGPVIASHSNLRSLADHPRNLTEDMAQAVIDTGGTIGVNFCRGFLSTDEEEHPANRNCAKSMINRLVELGSTDNVHIGSDFDGCTIPDDVGDMRIIPQLMTELQNEHELTADDISKITHGNMIRVIKEIWK